MDSDDLIVCQFLLPGVDSKMPGNMITKKRSQSAARDFTKLKIEQAGFLRFLTWHAVLQIALWLMSPIKPGSSHCYRSELSSVYVHTSMCIDRKSIYVYVYYTLGAGGLPMGLGYTSCR